MKSSNQFKNIQLIAFDVDGTLYVTESIIAPSYYSAVEKFNERFDFNLKKPTLAQLEHRIGASVNTILPGLFPDFHEPDKLMILGDMILEEFVARISRKEGKIYPGVKETLEILKSRGYTLALATNASFKYLKTIIRTFEIDKYFVPPIVVDGMYIKQKSDILTEYMSDYKIPAENMVMIGDRASDMQAAKQAGCHFIGVRYGFAPEEIERSECTISDIRELIELL